MAPPDWCRVFDVGDATVLPGLIDMHVHLCGDSEMGALDRLAHCSHDELDKVIERGLRVWGPDDPTSYLDGSPIRSDARVRSSAYPP
jgi:hypothetical protein